VHIDELRQVAVWLPFVVPEGRKAFEDRASVAEWRQFVVVFFDVHHPCLSAARPDRPQRTCKR
jgi:hypothetical protein